MKMTRNRSDGGPVRLPEGWRLGETRRNRGKLRILRGADVNSSTCRRSARGLLAVLGLALGTGLAAVSALADPAPAAPGEKALAIELNKLEPNGEACRAYLVLKNGSARAFESLKLDLVMFDSDGVVAKRLAVQAAPLPSGKTSLKVFDITGHGCGAIGSILLNDVLACEPAAEEGGDCLGLIAASARGPVPFIK